MAEITITEAEQRRASACILDVREDFEVEVEGSMIPGALHIPVCQMQARLSELDPAVPVIAVCRSGNKTPVFSQPEPSTPRAWTRWSRP